MASGLRPLTRHLLQGIAAAVLAAAVAGCASMPTETTGSIASNSNANSVTPRSEAEWRGEIDALATQHRANPRNADLAMKYARGLRALGQRTQAVAVLEQAALSAPLNKPLLGDYGRALADVGQYKKALDVLEKAHTPEDPDWRVLSAQGTVLDQLGRHGEA